VSNPATGGVLSESVLLNDEELFETLYQQVWRFAAVVATPGTDPDDLVQEALVRTLARRELADLDAPVPYLRKAVLNVVVDNQRRASRWRGVVRRLPDRSTQLDEFPSDLADLEHLSPVDRGVLYLTEIEGHSQAEAATMLGLTHDAVRLRASRARRRLRVAIEAEEAQ